MIAAILAIALPALFIVSAIGAVAVLADCASHGIATARRLRRELRAGSSSSVEEGIS